MRERLERSGTPRGRMAALHRAYTRAVTSAASTLMLAVVAVMGAQVFYRYVLNDSLIWAEEVSGYLLVIITFGFIGAAFERGEMVSIRVFTDLLPPRLRILLMIPSFAAMITFLLVLAYYAMRFASLGSGYNIPAVGFIGSTLLGRQAEVQVSMYWLYLVIPAGCVILSGHFLVTLWRLSRVALGRGDVTDALPAEPASPGDEVP
jgi:TRAP-type C4-dicarboxylate transport system permease small subunit